ncbi:hypothetical protein WKT07_08085 [Mediterraneibacter sp. HCN-7094]
MQNFDREHPQSIEKASGRCVILLGSIFTLSKMWDVDAKFAKGVSLNPRKGKMQMQLYMTGRLKSICKFEEKQVADTLVKKRASTTTNIKGLQIHQLPKEHLHKQINREYRYIRYQKSKSLIAPPISITIHHKARKRLCNPANWSRACPTKLSRSA